jgi:hypothetical protein
MTDAPAPQPDHSKLLRDNKLYAIACDTQLLSALDSDMSNKMLIELEFDDTAPRTEEDGDTTRVFITFRNAKGNVSLFKMTDPIGLDRAFDFDHFVAGYQQSVQFVNLPEDPIEVLNITFLSLMNSALADHLGFGERRRKANAQSMSGTVILSTIAVLFNNPLDMYIALAQRDADSPPVLQGMWPIKRRPVDLVALEVAEDANHPRLFSDLSTPEQVLSHRYISAADQKSTNVEYLGKTYRDSDGNTDVDGFKITWENGNASTITYWEGDSIKIAPTQDLQ